MTKDVLLETVKHVLTAPTGAYFEPLPVPMRFSADLDWDDLFAVSCAQGVGQIVGYALKWAEGTVDNAARFAETVNWAMALEATMHFETGELFKAFDREGIDYCPVNGLVTKKFYPLPWMRTMQDADVLVRNECIDKAGKIARANRYREESSAAGVTTFVSDSRLYRLELHAKLDVKGADKDIWQSLELADRNARRYEMTNVGQLVYILQRCQRHLNDGGIKVLSVLDFILLRRALGLDENVAGKAVESAGLGDMFETLDAVSRAWLDFGRLNRKQRAFVDNIFSPPRAGVPKFLSSVERAFKSFKTK